MSINFETCVPKLFCIFLFNTKNKCIFFLFYKTRYTKKQKRILINMTCDINELSFSFIDNFSMFFILDFTMNNLKYIIQCHYSTIIAA